MESLQELCCGILHSEQLCVESIFAVKLGTSCFWNRQSLQELCFEILHSEQVHLLCLHFLATAFTGM